jgi:hypothetical protein
LASTLRHLIVIFLLGRTRGFLSMSPCTATFQSYALSISCIERESALLSLSLARIRTSQYSSRQRRGRSRLRLRKVVATRCVFRPIKISCGLFLFSCLRSCDVAHNAMRPCWWKKINLALIGYIRAECSEEGGGGVCSRNKWRSSSAPSHPFSSSTSQLRLRHAGMTLSGSNKIL